MSGDVVVHIHAGGPEVTAVQATHEASECGNPACPPHRHEGDPTVRACPNPGAHEEASEAKEWQPLDGPQGVIAAGGRRTIYVFKNKRVRPYQFRARIESPDCGPLVTETYPTREAAVTAAHQLIAAMSRSVGGAYEAAESAPVIYEASDKKKRQAASPIASAVGAAVGTAVAASLAAEEDAPWAKVTISPDGGREYAKKIGAIDTPRKVYDLLHDEFHKRPQETFVVVPLNVHMELTERPIEVAYGQPSRVAVGVSDVMRAAVVARAERLVISHSHPSGHAKPSKADRELTEAIKDACKKVDIVFVDHVVVGDGVLYSIAENKQHRVK